MAITTLSSREFNQDTSRAKKAAQNGPVYITDRGRPAHVLLTMDEYQRLTGGEMTLIEALAQPGEANFDFDSPRSKELSRPADLSYMFRARHEHPFSPAPTGGSPPECRGVGEERAGRQLLHLIHYAARA